MRKVPCRRTLRAELLKEGVLTLDGFRWRDGYAWCEIQPTYNCGPNARCLRYLWATECGKGFGSALLCKVLRAADKCGIDLYVEVEPFAESANGKGWAAKQVREGGLNQSQLEAWYRRHGFKVLERNIMFRKAVPTACLSH